MIFHPSPSNNILRYNKLTNKQSNERKRQEKSRACIKNMTSIFHLLSNNRESMTKWFFERRFFSLLSIEKGKNGKHDMDRCCYLINLFFHHHHYSSTINGDTNKNEIMFQNIKTFPFCNIKWSVNNHTHFYINYRIVIAIIFVHSSTVLNEIASLKKKERKNDLFFSNNQTNQINSIQLMVEWKKKPNLNTKTWTSLFLFAGSLFRSIVWIKQVYWKWSNKKWRFDIS